MKSITEQIREVGDLVITTEVSGSDYLMFNDGSVECEVGEFLYGMVRVLKPRKVLETGSYKGISSSYIGIALKENGFGKLETIEYESQHITTSKNLWNELGLDDWIEVKQIDSREFVPTETYEMVFLDTEPNLRFGELVKMYPHLSPGGFIFIHDTPRNLAQGNINPDHPEIDSWPFGPLPREIKNWLKDGDLVKFHFPNPRGMTCFYKPSLNDYRPSN